MPRYQWANPAECLKIRHSPADAEGNKAINIALPTDPAVLLLSESGKALLCAPHTYNHSIPDFTVFVKSPVTEK